MIAVRVVSRAIDLRGLLPEWTQLFARDPRATPRNAPHLTYAFHQMFTPDTQPRVLVASDRAGVVRGVLPLGVRRRRIGPVALRELIPLISWHSYYADAVVDPECSAEVCRALRVTLLQSGWDRLVIRHVHRASWLLDPDVGVLSRLPWLQLTEGVPSAMLALTPLPELGRRSRQDRDRRERALRETGKIRMGWEQPGPGFQKAADDFVRLHTALKRHQRQNCTFRFGSAERDFPLWLEAEVSEGRAGLFSIQRAGVLLAGHVMLRGRQEAHSYRVAWAPEAAAFGLGILQTSRVIEACAALGDRRFDLGPGAEPYKQKWSPQMTTLLDLSGDRGGWRERAAAGWLRLRGRLPKL